MASHAVPFPRCAGGPFDLRPKRYLKDERPCGHGGARVGTRRVLWALGSATVAVLVLAAIVLGPSLGPRFVTPNEPGEEATPVTVPVWSAGDRWTYDVRMSPVSDGMEPASLDLGLFGLVTKTVVGTVNAAGADAYNVTVDVDLEGLLSAPWFDLDHVRITEAHVDGFTWYRVADLATLRDVRTLFLRGDVSSMSRTINASLTVRTDVVYEPAWDVWAFPIHENESWPSMTNATVRVESLFRVDAPDSFTEVGRNASFVLPISVAMSSAQFEDVTVPAGTFGAIRTSAARFDIERDDDPFNGMSALRLEEAPHASVDAWFSPDVGNVVRVVGMSKGSTSVRIEAVLVAFERA